MSERRQGWLALLLLGLMTLGELRLLDRLLYQNHLEVDFVLVNVTGILQGTPVWRSSQHRVLTPVLVKGLSALTGDWLVALHLLCNLLVASANVLLFGILRRKGRTLLESLLTVVLFAFVHLLLLYKLEYPWDGVDVLLFLLFGAWVSRRGREPRLLPLAPLLLVGTFNHETVLYIPLWYLLAPLDRAGFSRERKTDMAFAALATLLIGAVIIALRQGLYVGRPDLPGQAFEAVTPVVSNQLHASHNLREALFHSWRGARRTLIDVGLLGVIVGGGLVSIDRGAVPRAIVWSASVIAAVFLFGYLSEMRLYLPLIAFWFAHAWPPGMTVRAASHPPQIG
jgi:hypothetical protein